MKEYSEAFVGFDTAKNRHAMAIADGGRDGEVRYFGEIDSSPTTVAKVLGKLSARYPRLHICYEAGPTGYGLYRQVKALGHHCMVVAPSLIPRKPGDRVKTNRRDAVTLARLFRAGELTSVWVPDPVHEAVRDLVRAREAAAADLRKKRQQRQQRQQLLSLLLRHGRNFTGAPIGAWRIGAGSPIRGSSTRRNSSPSKTPSTQSRMPPHVCAGSTSSSSQSCRAGRWRR